MRTEKPANLEFVMLEMHMAGVDIVKEGFLDSLTSAVEMTGGILLFNARLDNDVAFQRCAAIQFARGHADECIALVLLSKDGHSVSVENAADSSHSLASDALRYAAARDMTT
jgi:hypothetical protein